MFHENHTRAIVKSVSWRIVASLTTFVIVRVLTGETGLATVVGLLDAAVKLILFFFHERLWNVVSLGRTRAGRPC